MASSENQRITNILLVGKTGVGKSSLINYLYDKPNFLETGDGKPVTPFGIHKLKSFQYKKLQICPFDSSGFEGGEQITKWRDNLKNELEKNQSSEIKDWFHTVIYCISAEGERIDDAEEKLVSEIVKQGNKVIFALTKADTIDEDKLQIMESVIKNNFGNHPIVRICSVEKRRRSGRVSQPFGREFLFNTICLNFRSNLIFKLLKKSELESEKRIDSFHRHVMQDFDDSCGFFTRINDDFVRDRARKMNQLFGEIIDLDAKLLNEYIGQVDELTADVLESYLGEVVAPYLDRLFSTNLVDSSMWQYKDDFFPFLQSTDRDLNFRRFLLDKLVEIKVKYRKMRNNIFQMILHDSEVISRNTTNLLGYLK